MQEHETDSLIVQFGILYSKRNCSVGVSRTFTHIIIMFVAVAVRKRERESWEGTGGGGVTE